MTVTWSPSTDTGGSGLAGYHVYRADQTGALATLPASATSFTDSSVQPSTGYSYTVDAFDGVPNTSAQSSPPAAVTTPAAPPSPCGGLAYPGSPPVYQHVVVIMDENLNYSAWHNSPAAPYSNLIASQCASAGNFLAITHPSQPNYLERRGRPVPFLERQRQGHHQRQPVPPVGRHRWGTHMGGTRGGHAQQLPNDGLRLLRPPPQPGHWFTDLGAAADRRRLLRHQRRGVHAFHVLTVDARLVHLGDAESVP